MIAMLSQQQNQLAEQLCNPTTIGVFRCVGSDVLVGCECFCCIWVLDVKILTSEIFAGFSVQYCNSQQLVLDVHETQHWAKSLFPLCKRNGSMILLVYNKRNVSIIKDFGMMKEVTDGYRQCEDINTEMVVLMVFIES